MRGLKRKFIVSLIAIMFAIVALGTTTYAYWSKINLTAEVTNQQVTIGKGRTATVTASLQGTLPTGTYLVPSGQKDNSTNPKNSVESVDFNYKVTWKDNLVMDSTETPLTVTIENLFLGGNNAYSGLVKPVINAPANITRGVDTEVTITLTLTEPGSKEVYDEIFDKNITFNVTFTVTPEPTPAI